MSSRGAAAGVAVLVAACLAPATALAYDAYAYGCPTYYDRGEIEELVVDGTTEFAFSWVNGKNKSDDSKYGTLGVGVLGRLTVYPGPLFVQLDVWTVAGLRTAGEPMDTTGLRKYDLYALGDLSIGMAWQKVGTAGYTKIVRVVDDYAMGVRRTWYCSESQAARNIMGWFAGARGALVGSRMPDAARALGYGPRLGFFMERGAARSRARTGFSVALSYALNPLPSGETAVAGAGVDLRAWYTRGRFIVTVDVGRFSYAWHLGMTLGALLGPI